jgi:orotate phosphoribosyltransferase
MSVASEIARRLLAVKAIQLNVNEPFTWASGILSPIYCDNRVALSFPELRTLLKHAFAEKAAQWGPFDVLAGVATGGIAIGALVADVLEKPFVYVRPSAKEHGRRNQIEGYLPDQARVVVIEDLIGSGCPD